MNGKAVSASPRMRQVQPASLDTALAVGAEGNSPAHRNATDELIIIQPRRADNGVCAAFFIVLACS